MDKTRERKITKLQMEDLISRFKTNAEMAEHMNVSRQLIYSLRRKYDLYNVADNKNSRNDRILRLYNEGGHTGAEIARKVNLSLSQVYRILWKMGCSGISLKKKSRWDILSSHGESGGAECNAKTALTDSTTFSPQSEDMQTFSQKLET